MPGLAESTDGFDPTEDLLDSLPLSLPAGVLQAAAWFFGRWRCCALRAGSALRGESPPLPGAYPRNLVCHSSCLRPTSPSACRHVQRRIPLGRSLGPREPCVHHQPVAVFHQYVAQIAELGFRSPRLPAQHRFRIAGGLMRLIAALFPVKVHRRVAAAIFRRWWRRVFALKTLLDRKSVV